jgi:hypothetical protein
VTAARAHVGTAALRESRREVLFYDARCFGSALIATVDRLHEAASEHDLIALSFSHFSIAAGAHNFDSLFSL